MILKPTPEIPEQDQLAGKGSSILNRQSTKQVPINEAITASNMNIKFDIRNNKLE